MDKEEFVRSPDPIIKERLVDGIYSTQFHNENIAKNTNLTDDIQRAITESLKDSDSLMDEIIMDSIAEFNLKKNF